MFGECEGRRYFNPRAPRGARLSGSLGSCRHGYFNPRAPCGARHRSNIARIAGLHFNPRAPCGARHFGFVGQSRNVISTHAPLAGRDNYSPEAALHEIEFQPTRPLRGATNEEIAALSKRIISTHAPLAGRDEKPRKCDLHPTMISTHAPLAGRDGKSVQITMHIFAITDKFQMLLHRMPPVRAFCSFLMQENHADFGCEPPK